MDINAGRILDGVSVREMGLEIFDALIEAASGKKTKSELCGIGEDEFSPGRWVLFCNAGHEMKELVDIVNFNGDASCLSSTNWLLHLQGKKYSNLCRWLLCYVKYEKKIVLGLTDQPSRTFPSSIRRLSNVSMTTRIFFK